MKAKPEVRVTLSAELVRHLRRRASALKIPIEWLVVGLVCDTLDKLAEAGTARPFPPS
jgi:hypothetical protein